MYHAATSFCPSNMFLLGGLDPVWASMPALAPRSQNTQTRHRKKIAEEVTPTECADETC